jgi:hypothetical protein
MSHTNDSQFVDSLLGKLYDIWGILSHKLLAVVRGVLVNDGDVRYGLMDAVAAKLLLEYCLWKF